jgi:uracil-DNA glycosylase
LDQRPNPSAELDEITRRLRTALEIQAILRDDASAAPPAALRHALRRPTGAGDASRARGRPAAAARVHAPAPAPVRPAVAPAPAAPVIHSWEQDPARFHSLGELHDAYGACQRCALGRTRRSFVFGVGSPNARVMFVGEAPGRDEDLQGEPFVGAAGQLLNRILDAIGFRREDVYIANILKCRPPGNRDPQPEEIVSCEPILRRQIEIIRPVVLCTLGAFAARTMLQVSTGISRLRARVHDYRGIPLVPTYHPAALLRNPSWKRPTWEDVQLLRREYDRLAAEKDAS